MAIVSKPLIKIFSLSERVSGDSSKAVPLPVCMLMTADVATRFSAFKPETLMPSKFSQALFECVTLPARSMTSRPSPMLSKIELRILGSLPHPQDRLPLGRTRREEKDESEQRHS